MTSTLFSIRVLKNEKENIDETELKSFKQYAENLFTLTDEQIAKLIDGRDLFEVIDDGKRKNKTRTSGGHESP